MLLGAAASQVSRCVSEGKAGQEASVGLPGKGAAGVHYYKP